MEEQPVAEGLCWTVRHEMRRSGRLQRDTLVLCLCRNGRLDYVGRIKN